MIPYNSGSVSRSWNSAQTMSSTLLYCCCRFPRPEPIWSRDVHEVNLVLRFNDIRVVQHRTIFCFFSEIRCSFLDRNSKSFARNARQTKSSRVLKFLCKYQIVLICLPLWICYKSDEQIWFTMPSNNFAIELTLFFYKHLTEESPSNEISFPSNPL